MRLVLRTQVRAARAGAAPATAPAGANAGRRAWIEALFGEHLPRGGTARERAIEALSGDVGVWQRLHQARHSMTETTAVIERLARAALAADTPRAA